jgi:hypothetical protein
MDASDAWLLLLPLLRAPPTLRDAAVALMAVRPTPLLNSTDPIEIPIEL